MVLSLVFRALCIALLFFGCTTGEYDNPYDPGWINYNPNLVEKSSCPNPIVSIGSVTCGGQKYRTVDIGGQVWFAENLNYEVSGSKCYNNNSTDCETYGRLYNWSTAMNLPSSCSSNSCSSQIQSKHRGICPDGWHIPSRVELEVMTVYIGGASTEGKKLKATSGWNSCGPSGSGNFYLCEDICGFSALPGGYGFSDGGFSNVGYSGHWWSTSEFNSHYAYYRDIRYNYESTYLGYSYKSGFYSVRCLKD